MSRSLNTALLMRALYCKKRCDAALARGDDANALFWGYMEVQYRIGQRNPYRFRNPRRFRNLTR